MDVFCFIHTQVWELFYRVKFVAEMTPVVTGKVRGGNDPGSSGFIILKEDWGKLFPNTFIFFSHFSA